MLLPWKWAHTYIHGCLAFGILGTCLQHAQSGCCAKASESPAAVPGCLLLPSFAARAACAPCSLSCYGCKKAGAAAGGPDKCEVPPVLTQACFVKCLAAQLWCQAAAATQSSSAGSCCCPLLCSACSCASLGVRNFSGSTSAGSDPEDQESRLRCHVCVHSPTVFVQRGRNSSCCLNCGRGRWRRHRT